jgi:DNA-binding PadR family transcriptional regulator
MSVPLCPVVLQLLADEPRDIAGLARELARRELSAEMPAHQAAIVTLERLQHAGLVYARGVTRSRRVFRITRPGKRELAFQRGALRLLARA